MDCGPGPPRGCGGEEGPTLEPRCTRTKQAECPRGTNSPPQAQPWDKCSGLRALGMLREVWGLPRPSLSHGWLRENAQAAAGLDAPAVARLQEATGPQAPWEAE